MTQEEEKKTREFIEDSIAEALKFVCAEAGMMQGGCLLGRMSAIMWCSMGTFISNGVIPLTKKGRIEFLIVMRNSCIELLKEIDKIEGGLK